VYISSVSHSLVGGLWLRRGLEAILVWFVPALWLSSCNHYRHDTPQMYASVRVTVLPL